MDRLEQPKQTDATELSVSKPRGKRGRYNIPDSDPADPKTWRPSRKSIRPIQQMLIDAEDHDLLAFQWFVGSDGYARRAVRTPAGRVTVHVHRMVLSRMLGRPLAKGEITDHINGVRLDNRRSNLRATDAAGNTQNTHGNRRNKAGGLRGVSWHKKAGKWQAIVRHNGRNQYLGLFTNPEEAAAVAAARRAQLGFADASPTSKELGNGSSASAA